MSGSTSTDSEHDLVIQTSDPDLNAGVALALRALRDGAVEKAGVRAEARPEGGRTVVRLVGPGRASVKQRRATGGPGA